MEIDAPPEAISVSPARLDWWEPTQPPTNLVFDDAEPLESNRHRIAMNVLIRSAQQALAECSDCFIGGNMFVYYSREQAMNKDFRGPDFFVALGVDKQRERQGWVIWEEGGHYPDVIVELLSESTADKDRGIKKALYERVFKTQNYFIFDPFDPNSLASWRLDGGHYKPLQRDKRGWLWCEVLDLWVGAWEGAIDQEPPMGTCHWLRFYDLEGNLVPLPEEAERERANQSEQKFEDLLTRLRQRGIDPETL